MITNDFDTAMVKLGSFEQQAPTIVAPHIELVATDLHDAIEADALQYFEDHGESGISARAYRAILGALHEVSRQASAQAGVVIQDPVPPAEEGT